jgi:hypothetical protein
MPLPDPCQLQGMIRSSPGLSGHERKGLSFVIRLKLALKRRLSVKAQRKAKALIGPILDFLSGRAKKRSATTSSDIPASAPLRAGDIVRVRSRAEISATLDHWNSYKGCGFIDEMSHYCDTTQKVLKRVERFMDERDYRFKKASGIVLLDGVICSGTSGTGRCDRSCFFFWREEWLEKVTSMADAEK